MRIFLVFILALFCFSMRGMPALAEGNTKGAIGVDHLMKNPGDYSGEIRVAGVVSQVFDDKGLFGLIDIEEFRKCGKVTCSSLMLPVSWPGPMPDVGSRVLLSGKIGKVDGRRLFIADKVDLAKDIPP